MKRRDFVLGATSSAGILLLDGAKAATPCSPALVGGGPDSCTAVDAESDWLARISAPGVVWYHDFRNEAEVNAFRWSGGYSGGNDPLGLGRPNTVIHQTADSVTGGGCLELFRPAGTNEGSSWWRPFSPLDTGSGKTVDDPGANGTLPAQTWAPSDGSSTTWGWSERASRPGFYGPEEYHDTARSDSHDGVGYYLQFRVKRDPRRMAANNTNTSNKRVGKLNYLTITKFSLSNQEIVTYSGGFASGEHSEGDPQYHRMYAIAFSPLESNDSLNRPGQQVGHEDADYGASSYCDITSQPGNCWSYSGGWDTLMYHIVPGRNGVEETLIVVYAANEGETEYTKIWDLVVPMGYSGDQGYTGGFSGPTGYNAFICSTYNNGEDMGTDFWERFDQLIFSKEFIPCPQA